MNTVPLFLLAWGALWLGLASFCLWTWVELGWADSCPSGWGVLRWPLTIGLSLGLLTLWMTVIGFRRLDVTSVLAFPALAAVSGLLIGLRRRRLAGPAVALPPPTGSRVRSLARGLVSGDVPAWVTLAAMGAAVAVLGHATYYPFVGDDELARYAYYARLVFLEKGVTDAVRGYPLLLPMAYAYVFLSTGQVAEQLARVVPALLSAATALATGALATRWYGSRAGYAAAFVLIASPLYLRYSPDGWVDIPSALFFVLCAYAGDVWLETRRRKWAVLAGICAGLALWTKQAGFIALGSLGAIWIWAVVRDGWRGERARAWTAVRDGTIALGTALLFGGWWFLRNASYDGWRGAIPTPGILYDAQVRHGWNFFVPFVHYRNAFGLFSSSLCLTGLAWALIRPRRSAWPLAWALAYTLVWHQWFSYDARFLLTVLPFYAILFGGATTELRRPLPTWARWAVCGIVVTAAGTAIVQAELGGIRRWVVAPGASYAERINRLKGDMYPTVEFLRDHVPATARLVTMDTRMPYYLMDRQIRVSYPRRLSELGTDDYLVTASWGPSVYAGLGAADNEVLRALGDEKRLEKVWVSPRGDFVVFRILKP